MIRASELDSENDRLLLEGQRAASRDDWGAVVAAADEVLKNEPRNAQAMFLAAAALRRSGNDGVALQLLSNASQLEPKRGAIWLQMAMCLHERRPKEAYQAALKAQTLMPDTLDGLSVLCNVASTLGRHAEAVNWAERSELLHGLQPEVSHNESFALFALGRWAEAWKAFRPSLGMPNRKARNYHSDRETPRWNPNKHEGAVVALYGEQGIGDEIMYASMIPAAIKAAEAKGSRVVIECHRRNAELFERSFGVPCHGYSEYAEWPVDEGITHRLEFGGLGEYFAPEPFRRDRYLIADPARKAGARAWLDQFERGAPRVGLAWTGGAWESGRARRSIPFDLILQLMRGQDAQFVCLEYEDRKADLKFAPEVLNPHWATRKGQDMDDLAALVSNLDIVIAVQTSVVDLCGALGVPCWAIADEVPQWRYTGFFGDDTMAFYESVKVYRQAKWGEWAPVIQRVSRDLKEWTEARKPKTAAYGAQNRYLNGQTEQDWKSC